MLEKLLYRIYSIENVVKKHNVILPSLGEIEDYFDKEIKIKTEPEDTISIKEDPDVSFENNTVNAPHVPDTWDEGTVKNEPNISSDTSEASFETGDFIPIFKTPQTGPPKSSNNKKFNKVTAKPEPGISSNKSEATFGTGDFIPIFKTPQPVPPKSPPPNFKAFDFSPSTSKQKEHPTVPEVEQEYDCDAGDMILDLRNATSFKYGYNDIITGSFATKLEESLSTGIKIIATSPNITELNNVFYNEYNSMVNRDKYNKMLEFRKKLPAYKKSADILDALNNNQVLVISGETGCGKSTQVNK